MENHVSTTICVPLSGSNHTVYLITVNAVNVVGSGVNTSGTCTHTAPSGNILVSYLYLLLFTYVCIINNRKFISVTILKFCAEFITRWLH